MAPSARQEAGPANSSAPTGSGQTSSLKLSRRNSVTASGFL